MDTQLITRKAFTMRSLSILFAPGPLPAFTDLTLRGYWTRYAEVDADGLTQLESVVELTLGPSNALGRRHVNVDVFLRDFPTTRYGLIYGDDTFETALDTWLCRRLDLAREDSVFVYSEQGMQPQDGAHLETGRAVTAQIAAMSAHTLRRLMRDPAVFELSRDDVTLVERSAPDWIN